MYQAPERILNVASSDMDSDNSDTESDNSNTYGNTKSLSDSGTEVLVAPFQHNFLHDIESVWWVVVWIMLELTGFDQLRELARLIFTANQPSAGRRKICETTHEFAILLRGAMPKELRFLYKRCN